MGVAPRAPGRAPGARALNHLGWGPPGGARMAPKVTPLQETPLTVVTPGSSGVAIGIAVATG